MSDNNATKYLKRGLLITLFASASMSSMAQSQTFEDFKKEKLERFGKFRQHQKAERESFQQQRNELNERKSVDNQDKVQEIKETGVSKATVYSYVPAEIFQINLQKSIDSKDGKMFMYVGTEGVAFKMESSSNYYGAQVNKKGEIKYYMCGSQDDDKVELEEVDPSLVKMVGLINQAYGDQNSNFSKALVGQEKVNQAGLQSQQKSQKTQTVKWVKGKYGIRPNIQPDRSVIAQHLLPRARYNSKTKLYSVGYVKSHNETTARQLARLEIQCLATEEKLAEILQKQAETRQLGQEEQDFLKGHSERMEKMGLSFDKEGKLHQKAHDDTSQNQNKTLDLTPYFMNQGGYSQS